MLLVAVATVMAFVVRDNFVVDLQKVPTLWAYFTATIVTASVVIPLFGLNRSVWRFTSLTDYLYVMAATVAIVLGAVIINFAFSRLDGVARSIPFIQGMLILILLVGARVFMRLRHASRGQPVAQFSNTVDSASLRPRSVLIVGLNRLTELYLQSAHEFNPGRVHIAGLIGSKEHQTGRLMHRYKVLGVPEQIASIIKDLEVHGIFVHQILVTSAWSSLGQEAQNALREIEATSDVRVLLLAQSLGFDSPDWGADPVEYKIADRSAADSHRDPHRSLAPSEEAVLKVDLHERDQLKANPYWRLKRSIDVLAALILIVLLAPVMIVIAVLAAMDVGHPILFWQQRPGLAGRPFRIYKLRTMKASHDESGRHMPDRERLTSIGRFLRRTRLDELPQLFHILWGQMSFVGPRPLLPVDQPVGYAARLLVRPGLTGWAQVRGGRHLSAVDKAALDIWYVRNASFRLDLEILVRTVVMVLLGEKPDAEAIRKAWGGGASTASTVGDVVTDDACRLLNRAGPGRRIA